jgi:hypothetical protein
MRALLFVFVLAGCGDDHKASPKDGGVDAIADASGSGTLRACLDHPSNEAKPLTGGLPCDLLPPGFGQ